ncbi:MAG: translation initiation factor IF-5A [Candidatus Woesearchaeota archaeon]
MTGETKLVSVGSLTKGSYVIVDEAACRVVDLKVSRPGKHGHAKVNLTAVGILDDKKRNLIMPGHDNIEVPIIGKKTAQVLSVTDKSANVMDQETFETFDLEIPEDLEGQVNVGNVILYWQVLSERVMKQIKE